MDTLIQIPQLLRRLHYGDKLRSELYLLKSVLYYLILLTTGVRLVDMVYLLVKGGSNLPVSVMAVTGVMILYGIVIAFQKRSVKIRSLIVFFAVHAALVVVNLVTVKIHVPMQITVAETLIVGSFLDIVIDACAMYAGLKFMSSEFQPFVRVIETGD